MVALLVMMILKLSALVVELLLVTIMLLPVIVQGIENSMKDLCYSQPAFRLKPVSGTFQEEYTRHPLYWNLSCPMESSKWSCSHFGHDVEHAAYAARLEFKPSSCYLHSASSLISHLALITPPKRLVFIGNSMTKQVLTSLVCQAHGLQRANMGSNATKQSIIKNMTLGWRSCNASKPYPCHGQTHCVTCGQHSGIDTQIHIEFTSGTTLEYHDSMHLHELHTISELRYLLDRSKIDIMVLQSWLKSSLISHIPFMERYASYILNRRVHSLPKLIQWNHWASNFPQGGMLYAEKDGGYNESHLQMLMEQNKPLDCLPEAVINSKSEDYSSSIINGRLRNWKPDGFVSFGKNALNSLGKAKVGTSVGAYGDCQHFCLPGPPDELVRLFLQMILALLEEGITPSIG